METFKKFFNDQFKKVRRIAYLAAAAGVTGLAGYLAGVDTTAVFGVAGGAIASYVLAYFTREGASKVIAYLEDHADDDGDVFPV